MEISELFELLEGVAPLKLSREYCEKYDAYDNSGILINCNDTLTGALFSLDFSLKAVNRAKELGYNLLVTHHPAIFGGINKIDVSAGGQDQAIAECVKSGISVISAHLNLDAAPRGIDYFLMRAFGGSNPEIMEKLTEGGYGRAYDIAPVIFGEMQERVKATFKTERALFYGDSDKRICRAASFCGAGCSERSVDFALKQGADLFISSDFKHHLIAKLNEKGVCVIQLTHYASEYYGFERIYSEISEKINLPCAIYCDGQLM